MISQIPIDLNCLLKMNKNLIIYAYCDNISITLMRLQITNNLNSITSSVISKNNAKISCICKLNKDQICISSSENDYIKIKEINTGNCLKKIIQSCTIFFITKLSNEKLVS